MNEADAYQKFRKEMQKINFHDRIERIENLLANGTPDVNCCLEGVDMWIELKAPKEPKRATTPLFGSNHKLSQDQMNWFLKQRNAGGVAWILIRTDHRWILINGKLADNVNKMTVAELCLCSQYNALEGNMVWPRLRKLLLTKPRRLGTSSTT